MTAALQSKAMPYLEVALKAIETEAKGLTELKNSLGNEFVEAIETLLNAKGRVVVTGMGKSGLVAHKISATLSSTGCPSLFVHPGEASHGDLGMIMQDDVVIALSNSGETSELSNVIQYAKRQSIPLIGMTSRRESSLVSSADIALVLPSFNEACPMGLAPTTSTTMMMALGDALAVALLSAKGFSDQDFRIFHPGGNLGDRLRHVEDRMHKGDSLPLVSADSPMKEAIITMSSKGFGCVGVVNEDSKFVGIVTDGDLRRHMGVDLLDKVASDVMTGDPVTISPKMLMAEALALLNQRGITAFFVVEDGQPIGIIHVHDFLRSGVI